MYTARIQLLQQPCEKGVNGIILHCTRYMKDSCLKSFYLPVLNANFYILGAHIV